MPNFYSQEQGKAMTESWPTDPLFCDPRKSLAFPPTSQFSRIDEDDEQSNPDALRGWDSGSTPEVIHPAIEISPPEAVRRRIVTGRGMAVEFVESASQHQIQYRFRAPMHLLLMYEKGDRRDGETFVEGLPRSTLRRFTRKLTFVPAGHEYYERNELGTDSRRLHFYFDPATLGAQPEADKSFVPRLLFEDTTLLQTALKLKHLVEHPALADRIHFELLGRLLVHELVLLGRCTCGRAEIRGGLAAWQERAVRGHIEENFAEKIPISTIARLIRLSRFHFCRAFRQSFGTTPHRYQMNCRIEQAKLLLANSSESVTAIGFLVGFSSSPSFATAFRKATGVPPTAYRRSLVSAFGDRHSQHVRCPGTTGRAGTAHR
jgi:AraC family transcriptional regulator